MKRPNTETIQETIQAQAVIIERLREDNKALTKSAVVLLDEFELQKAELRNLRKLVSELLGTAPKEETT